MQRNNGDLMTGVRAGVVAVLVLASMAVVSSGALASHTETDRGCSIDGCVTVKGRVKHRNCQDDPFSGGDTMICFADLQARARASGWLTAPGEAVIVYQRTNQADNCLWLIPGGCRTGWVGTVRDTEINPGERRCTSHADFDGEAGPPRVPFAFAGVSIAAAWEWDSGDSSPHFDGLC